MDRDDLLQPSLRGDVRMEALARLAARISALPVSTPLVNLFDLVDASALPALGEQFHILGVEGWNLAGTEAARRALLKRAIELHRHKGTPWAVRSWLECLETFTRRPLPIAVATAGVMRTLNRVRLHFPPEPAAPARPRIAFVSLICSRGRLRPFTPPRPVPAARGRVALALLTMTRSRVCPQP